MGSLKGKQVSLELTTYNELRAKYKSADDRAQTAGNMILKGQSELDQALQMFTSVIKEGNDIIAKAKDIGADSIVKETSELVSIAEKYKVRATKWLTSSGAVPTPV